jgi:hypothetical protein
MGREVRDKFDQLHTLYGRDQSLQGILDGSTRGSTKRGHHTAPDGRCGRL